MPNLPQSGLELIAETSKYSRGINNVIADSGRVDSALSDIVRSADRAEGALNAIDGNIDVRIDTDLGDDAAIRAIEGLVDRHTVNIDTPLGDRAGIRAVEGLPDDADVNVDVREGDTAAIAVIQAQLEALQVLGVIQLALLLPTNLADVTETLSNLPVIGQILEMEEAVQSINARVVDEIPNAADVINNLYVQAWGESRQEIADLIVELDRLGVANEDLEDVATAAFQAASIGQADTNEVLRAADQLVSNQLVGSYREAFDFITRGYQEGFDQSGDFLDTLTEYSPVFADNGLDAQAFFTILNAGLEAGAFNTDKLADGFKEMLNLTREEISIFDAMGDETDRTRALEELGLGDEATAFAAGEITGTAFSDGVLDSLRALEDPAEQRRLALAIFSPTMVEDIGLPALLAIDLEQSSDLETAWQNSANEAADIYFSTIGTAFTELSRTIEVELTEAINNSLNLDDWLNEARTKVQTLADELQAGRTLGEALEIALEIPGLADQITRLESTLGNVALAIVDAFAAGLDLIGQHEAAEGLRGAVVPLAEGQFTFDLQFAESAEDIAATVNTALDRGVDPTIVALNIEQAISEAIERGDLDAARHILAASGELFSQSGGRLREELMAGLENAPELRARLHQALGFEDLAEVTNEQLIEGLRGLEDEFVNSFTRAPTVAEDAIFDTLETFESVSMLPEMNIAGLREQVREAVQAANDAFTEAINSGDFDAAQQIAESLNDPQLYVEAFQEALRTGNVGEAVEIATSSGDETLIAEAERQAQLYRDSFEANLEAGQIEPAIRIAEQLGDEELIERAEAMRAQVSEAVGGLADDVTAAGDEIHDVTVGHSIASDFREVAAAAIGSFPLVVAPSMLMAAAVQGASIRVNAGLMGIRNTAAVAMPQAAGFVNNLTQEIYGLGNTAPVLDSIISKLQQLASAGTSARQVLSSVASAGREAASVTNNNTTVNVNQTNNVQSSAQAASLGFANSRAIRGFG